MERFVTRHGTRIVGILSGFDRLLFRGTLRWLCYPDGVGKFLGSQGVLYKDFGAYAERLSDRVKTQAIAMAANARRPYEYLASPQVSKEDRARLIAQRDRIDEGLVCVLSCVEPCRSFTVRRDRARRDIRLVASERKCLHLYFYFMDRDFGLMHVRLQTWLPFTIQVCVNGRTWLACQLRRLGIAHTQVDNCFTMIADLPRAQTVADDLIDWSWEPWLRRLARLVNPWLTGADSLFGRGYYWSIRQSEFATDVIFRNAPAIQAVYPTLLRHAIETFHSEDVLRFLGHQPIGFSREVRSTLERRIEAVRIRHWVNENSIKMYDKAGSLLRIETTMNNPDRFKVRRRRPSDGRLDWLPLRRGIADIRRRAAICLAANARYLDALSVVGEATPSHCLLDPVSERVTHHGRPYRALRPISPQEAPLLQTIFRGEFRLQGFTNRDVRTALDSQTAADPIACRRVSARVTRQLRLLRAHRLIKKVSGTHLYRITKRGEAIISTALRFRETDMALLAA
jgi:hypothetical protein